MNISMNQTWTKFIGMCMIALFLCSGCVTNQPISHEALTPANIIISANYDDSVTVVVENGREFSKMNLPKLSNEALGTAVRNAIKESKLFSEILPNGGRYSLELYVVNISQPYAGKNMTAGVEIAWTLKDMTAGKLVWKESIQTQKTVPQEEAFAAIDRIKKATELAAKENIELGIKKLSALNL
jgi:hypothetical protein